MAAPKTITRKAGDKFTSPADTDVQVPLNLAQVAAAVVQLQNTMNDLIATFNAHVHVENTNATYVQNASTAAPAGANAMDGSGASATNLFTTS